VVIPRQVLRAFLHDDPAIFDDIAAIDSLQTLAHVLLGDEEGDFILISFSR